MLANRRLIETAEREVVSLPLAMGSFLKENPKLAAARLTHADRVSMERLPLLLVSSRWSGTTSRSHLEGRQGMQDLARVRRRGFQSWAFTGGSEGTHLSDRRAATAFAGDVA